MAHIVSCMLDADPDDFTLSLNNYIAKAVTPKSSNDSLVEQAPSSTTGPEKAFCWRMHQPERKYQLFPKEKAAASAGKGLDPEQAFAHVMGQNGEKSEKASNGSGLRIRIKEHSLIRRRKISVPDLGPMTTVQEVAMDSPTIPGRPPLHERSISAPGSSWRMHHLANYVTALRCQMPDGKAEFEAGTQMNALQEERPINELRQPLSPRSLAPLVIPPRVSAASPLATQQSISRLRSDSTPMEPSNRAGRRDDSPKTRTPFTPFSASTTLTTPRSALSHTTNSTLATPVSAPVGSRSSPTPWDHPAKPSAASATGTTQDENAEAKANATPRVETEARTGSAFGHRRNQSESGSIMERGRPRKRSEKVGATPCKRTASKRSTSAERRAFEQLPKGWKATDAIKMLDYSEAIALQKQALQQASRFEVLRKDDVDGLSRELRNLDERTEYLRRTYTSLRAGRRNLHTRICQYLRSPRTAKFSHDSMLKQEEALADLDASIDDWVTKLEQAENRRTRVRQKLLEHVAAAATLPLPPPSPPPVVGVSESLQLAMGIRPPTGAGNLSTPPRSPTKPACAAPRTQSASPSPQRVVPQVPSTIFEQPLRKAADTAKPLPVPKADDAGSIRRAETIHIFADNDVYTLLADVEDQITKMSGDISASASKEAALSEEDRKGLHRAQSHELLERQATSPPAPKPETCPRNEEPPTPAQLVFLTNAVFKP